MYYVITPYVRHIQERFNFCLPATFKFVIDSRMSPVFRETKAADIREQCLEDDLHAVLAVIYAP